jgi:hypothetical protein
MHKAHARCGLWSIIAMPVFDVLACNCDIDIIKFGGPIAFVGYALYAFFGYTPLEAMPTKRV